MTLEISKEEFFKNYGGYDLERAKTLVNQHLKHHGDDGRPKNINIQKSGPDNIIRITADLNYLDNDHTGYSIH